jgi:hypothetical protein
MLEWLKKNYQVIIATIVTVSMGLWLYCCEPKTHSVLSPHTMVTRAELEVELDNIMKLAEQRMVDLNRQEAIRNLILQNALLVVGGQPLNPVGLLTAFAAIYGVGVAGSKTVTAVKNGIKKRAVSNG